jgi:hypothetical protein
LNGDEEQVGNIPLDSTMRLALIWGWRRFAVAATKRPRAVTSQRERKIIRSVWVHGSALPQVEGPRLMSGPYSTILGLPPTTPSLPGPAPANLAALANAWFHPAYSRQLGYADVLAGTSAVEVAGAMIAKIGMTAPRSWRVGLTHQPAERRRQWSQFYDMSGWTDWLMASLKDAQQVEAAMINLGVTGGTGGNLSPPQGGLGLPLLT